MDWNFISNLILASVRMATPLLFLSLAELYSQRAGLVHIGLEGLASIGSLVGFLVCLITGDPFLGVLAGAAAGIAVNMIYAYATINLCAEQIVYGMAINIFAPALAACVRLSVQPMLDIRTGPYGSTAPRSDCFEPADEEQCTARLRALRRRARTLLHRMSEWLDAHAGEHPEYQPRENIFKRCTIDGNLVQIH